MTRISSSYSIAVIFLPISPRPPSGMIFTFSFLIFWLRGNRLPFLAIIIGSSFQKYNEKDVRKKRTSARIRARCEGVCINKAVISDRLIYEVRDFAAHVRAAPKWRLCRLIKLAKQAPCSREAANDCCESNKDIRRRRQESREAAHCFEVCKTSKLPCTRSVLPRQGHAFHAMESSRKGDGMLLFAACKK